MKNRIIPIGLIISIFFVSLAYCQPIITMSDAFLSQKGKVIVPIILENESETPVYGYGYAFRIDYDSTVLSDPSYLTSGTMSENNEILFTLSPWDNYGKISISSHDLQSDQGQILIKLVFDIVRDKMNIQSNITFIDTNVRTVLYNSEFDKIEAHFESKTITIKNFNLEYLIRVFKKVSTITSQ